MTDFKRNDPTMSNLSTSDQQRVLKMLQKGASRRDVMGWMMAAGATATASGTVFGSMSKAWAATPKKGGKLIMAADQHGPNDTLDPALYTSAADYFRGRMFYGSLTRLTSDLGYEPELAEEVMSNDDATEWTFKIRKGVEFHDGKTLTADDVIYTMNRHLGEDSISKASSLVSMVKEWKKVGKYEVKAILSSANADLPIALGTFHFKIIQDGQEDFATTVGTGPYKVKEFKPGVRAVGERFDNYWGEGGYLDELEHYGIGDSTARLNAFLAGDVDAMVNLPPKAIAQVEKTEGKEIWSLKAGAYVNITPRLDMADSNNVHLYKTMQALQDRQRLVKGVMKGQGSLTSHSASWTRTRRNTIGRNPASATRRFRSSVPRLHPVPSSNVSSCSVKARRLASTSTSKKSRPMGIGVRFGSRNQSASPLGTCVQPPTS